MGHRVADVSKPQDSSLGHIGTPGHTSTSQQDIDLPFQPLSWGTAQGLCPCCRWSCEKSLPDLCPHKLLWAICSSMLVVILHKFSCESAVDEDRSTFFLSAVHRPPPLCVSCTRAQSVDEICCNFSGSDFCIVRNSPYIVSTSVNATVS